MDGFLVNTEELVFSLWSLSALPKNNSVSQHFQVVKDLTIGYSFSLLTNLIIKMFH